MLLQVEGLAVGTLGLGLGAPEPRLWAWGGGRETQPLGLAVRRLKGPNSRGWEQAAHLTMRESPHSVLPILVTGEGLTAFGSLVHQHSTPLVPRSGSDL